MNDVQFDFEIHHYPMSNWFVVESMDEHREQYLLKEKQHQSMISIKPHSIPWTTKNMTKKIMQYEQQ